MNKRYIVMPKSKFSTTPQQVLDTTKEKDYLNPVICECETLEEATLICNALNEKDERLVLGTSLAIREKSTNKICYSGSFNSTDKLMYASFYPNMKAIKLALNHKFEANEWQKRFNPENFDIVEVTYSIEDPSKAVPVA